MIRTISLLEFRIDVITELSELGFKIKLLSSLIHLVQWKRFRILAIKARYYTNMPVAMHTVELLLQSLAEAVQKPFI